MTSLDESLSSCLSLCSGMNSRPRPAEKRKLCRVSKGLANNPRLLLLNSTHATQEKMASSGERMLAESIVQEVGGVRLVEISIVRGNSSESSHSKQTALGIQAASDKNYQLSSCKWQNGVQEVLENDLFSIPEETFTADRKQHGKRVGFSDDLKIHSFETEEDSSSDTENDTGNEQLEDVPLNEVDHSIVGRCNSATSNTMHVDPEHMSVQTSQVIVSKRKLLRQVILSQVVCAHSRANLLKSFFTGSFRKPSSYSYTKTQLERTRSLPGASVRHSFLKIEDHSGSHIDLAIPLGNHYVPNSILVKTSGDGKKIKVSANRKRSLGKTASEDFVGDYREWFYMPKAIDPRQTSAVVDQDGYLKIKAPFCARCPQIED